MSYTYIPSPSAQLLARSENSSAFLFHFFHDMRAIKIFSEINLELADSWLEKGVGMHKRSDLNLNLSQRDYDVGTGVVD